MFPNRVMENDDGSPRVLTMDETHDQYSFMLNESERTRSSMETFAYIEVCYLFLFVAIGVPINVFTLARVGRQYYVTKSRILLLNVNLNISDLMILLFYAFTTAVWFTTNQWYGGVLLCKCLKFFQLFSFCLSSNVIVCIGVDRLWSLLAPLHVKSAANRRCRRMVAIAWILASVCSAPQLYLWNVEVQSDPDRGVTFYQCVNTYGLPMNSTEEFEEAAGNATVLYDIYTMLVTFWLPCIFVVICYVIILKRVLKHLGDDPQVEFVQTKTCDCSSGASAAAVGSPSLEAGVQHQRVRRQRQQYRREPPRSERRFSGTHAFKKCPPACDSCSGRRPSVTVQQQNVLRRSAGQMRIRRTKYRTLKVTMFIVAAYIICWLPYNFLSIWTLVYPNLSQSSLVVVNFLCGLIAVNAIVNPLIYGRLTLALYWRGGVGGLRRKQSALQKAAKRFDGRAVRFI